MPAIVETVRNYLRDRRALEELEKLDDRMLRDIGLIGVDLNAALKAKSRAAADRTRSDAS